MNGMLGKNKTGLKSARFLCVPIILLQLTLFLSGMTSGLPAFSQGDGESPYQSDGGKLSPALNRVRTLIRANVLDLAQSILETEGPPVVPTTQWIEWERQLWALYRLRNNWNGLLDRVAGIPPGFPDAIKFEAEVQSVEALIELQRGRDARRVLRPLMLRTNTSEVDKKAIRENIIKSYLADELLKEATVAMGVYQSDYRSQEEGWLLLSAQVYLKIGNSDTAINLLAPLDSPKARLLRVYARIQNNSVSATQVLDKTADIRKMQQQPGSKNEVEEFEIVAVETYSLIKENSIRAISSLENYISLTRKAGVIQDRAFPVYTVDDLLGRYTESALKIANQNGFLEGESSRFFDFAVQLPQDQITSRKSVYGYLLQLITHESFRFQLINFYVNTLIESQSVGVISSLFGDDKPFGPLKLSGNVGLALSNRAIETGDIVLAAFVNRSLTETPSGMDRYQWMLHVARVSIIAGQYKSGKETLDQWIAGFPKMQPDQIDQILQPVFDLQAVNQHNLALDLLLQIEGRVTTAKQEREIAYWMAESFQATRQYISAADYFLYSALLKDNGFDQWGESARFRAAECLQSANLVADARAMFQTLHDRTNDDTRKGQLQQRIQELWLLESSLENIDHIQ